VRVAIVHEKITIWSGSERVLEALHAMFPSAPIHVAVVDRDVLPRAMAKADIRPTGLQRLYRGGDRYAHLLPLLPGAFRRMDLADADVVITSHHAFANRVRPASGVPVISYTHTPARWIWDPAMRAGEVGGRIGGVALTLFAATQRRPDRAAAARLRGIIANSTHVADRVARWWGRDAGVVHPPVDTDFFTPDPSIPREDFFLLAGRLVSYKRPLVAMAAARQAGVRLVVVGDGRLRPEVDEMAGDGIEVLGAVGAEELRDLMRRCRALVFPGEEDFGILPVEAQACGAPVLSPALGGAIDTIVDGVSGVLYPPRPGGWRDALAEALRSFDPSGFTDGAARRSAERFAPDRFRAGFLELAEEMLGAELTAEQ
jgi:glycosyltransferase involved in cell wall biosynthesis